MKKNILLLLFFILTDASHAQSNESTINILKGIFPLYFDDMVKEKPVINKDVYTDFLFRNDGGIEKIIAIGYIEGYKGQDLFITHTDYSYKGTGDKDMYNPTDFSYMYIFKEGKLVDNEGDSLFINYNGYNLINDERRYIKRSYMQDEAIDYNLDSWINKDTTITFNVSITEYSLPTGFDSQFNKSFSIDCNITEKGQFVVKDVNDIILDSPLFHSEKRNDVLQDIPTKKHPYNFFDSSHPVYFNYLFPERKLNFYLSENNEPVFDLFYKGNLISSFTQNEEQSNQSKTDQKALILDYPIKIKIDNDIILLDAYGVFRKVCF